MFGIAGAAFGGIPGFLIGEATPRDQQIEIAPRIFGDNNSTFFFVCWDGQKYPLEPGSKFRVPVYTYCLQSLDGNYPWNFYKFQPASDGEISGLVRGFSYLAYGTDNTGKQITAYSNHYTI